MKIALCPLSLSTSAELIFICHFEGLSSSDVTRE